MSEKRKLPHDATPDVHAFHAPPETIRDIINGWGTYNIQATARACLPSGKTASSPRTIWKKIPDARAASSGAALLHFGPPAWAFGGLAKGKNMCYK